MTAGDLFSRSELGGAIEQATARVRSLPLDASARFTLLDLLCFASQWDRASAQVGVLEAAPDGPAPGLPTYRHLIAAERSRANYFAAGDPSPGWMIEPPSWANDHIAACEHLRRGDYEKARSLMDRGQATRRPLHGGLGGGPVEGFRDLDDVLGPVLEVFAPGGYYWVPWEDVRFLDVAPPANLCDLLWAPARIALAQGPMGRVHIPTLYPNSGASADGLIQVGRKTDWRELAAGLVRGLGLKMFLVGEESRTVFELRDLRFPPATTVTGPA